VAEPFLGSGSAARSVSGGGVYDTRRPTGCSWEPPLPPPHAAPAITASSKRGCVDLIGVEDNPIAGLGRSGGMGRCGGRWAHSRRPRLLWALQGLNLRLRPCEGRTLPLS